MKYGKKFRKLIIIFKEDSKTNPQNQKSWNLDQNSQRNNQVNEIEISKFENREKPKLKLKLTKNYDSKLKSKAIQKIDPKLPKILG